MYIHAHLYNFVTFMNYSHRLIALDISDTHNWTFNATNFIIFLKCCALLFLYTSFPQHIFRHLVTRRCKHNKYIFIQCLSSFPVRHFLRHWEFNGSWGLFYAAEKYYDDKKKTTSCMLLYFRVLNSFGKCVWLTYRFLLPPDLVP